MWRNMFKMKGFFQLVCFYVTIALVIGQHNRLNVDQCIRQIEGYDFQNKLELKPSYGGGIELQIVERGTQQTFARHVYESSKPMFYCIGSLVYTLVGEPIEKSGDYLNNIAHFTWAQKCVDYEFKLRVRLNEGTRIDQYSQKE